MVSLVVLGATAPAAAQSPPLPFGPELEVGSRTVLSVPSIVRGVAAHDGASFVVVATQPQDAQRAALWGVWRTAQGAELARRVLVESPVPDDVRVASAADRVLVATRTADAPSWSVLIVAARDGALDVRAADDVPDPGDLAVAGSDDGWLLVTTDLTSRPHPFQAYRMTLDGDLGAAQAQAGESRSSVSVDWDGTRFVLGWVSEQQAHLAWIAPEEGLPVVQEAERDGTGTWARVSADPSTGEVLLAWRDGVRVFATRVAPDGSMEEPEVIVSPPARSLEVGIAASPEGWLLVWREYDTRTRLLPQAGPFIDGDRLAGRTGLADVAWDGGHFVVASSGAPTTLAYFDQDAHLLSTEDLDLTEEPWMGVTMGTALVWTGSRFLLLASRDTESTWLAHWLRPTEDGTLVDEGTTTLTSLDSTNGGVLPVAACDGHERCLVLLATAGQGYLSYLTGTQVSLLEQGEVTRSWAPGLDELPGLATDASWDGQRFVVATRRFGSDGTGGLVALDPADPDRFETVVAGADISAMELGPGELLLATTDATSTVSLRPFRPGEQAGAPTHPLEPGVLLLDLAADAEGFLLGAARSTGHGLALEVARRTWEAEPVDAPALTLASTGGGTMAMARHRDRAVALWEQELELSSEVRVAWVEPDASSTLLSGAPVAASWLGVSRPFAVASSGDAVLVATSVTDRAGSRFRVRVAVDPAPAEPGADAGASPDEADAGVTDEPAETARWGCGCVAGGRARGPVPVHPMLAGLAVLAGARLRARRRSRRRGR